MTEPTRFETDEVLRKALRTPLAKEKVGKLPRVICKACRDSRSKVCAEHKKAKCNLCKQFMTTEHMHLDYVGHAAVTDILNHIDPAWNYDLRDIVEYEANGERHVRAVVGYVTVGGKSILESGDCERTERYGEELKIAIGDLIRRGAMRFGLAIDLWSKEDLAPMEEPAKQERRPPQQVPAQRRSEPTSMTGTTAGATAPPVTNVAGALEHLLPETREKALEAFGGKRVSAEAYVKSMAGRLPESKTLDAWVNEGLEQRNAERASA